MSQNPFPSKRYYTLAESAKVLGITTKSLRELIQAGQVPAEAPLGESESSQLRLSRQVLVQCAANSTQDLQLIPEVLRTEVSRLRRKELKVQKSLIAEGVLHTGIVPLPVRDRSRRRQSTRSSRRVLQGDAKLGASDNSDSVARRPDRRRARTKRE